MTAGVFYFFCLSIGDDSPGWVLAFSPGDGNPAHAGTAGGPRMIGAMNSFNTPAGAVGATQTAATGHSLHAVTETGETGWVQIQMNPYPSINTSNTANIPATSASCSSLGIAGDGECIRIDINSYTAGGVTGYEPYLEGYYRKFQFTGAPGELRTAQLGDTACVAASTVTNCSWSARMNELLTLVQKGADGHWVFRRNSYGAQAAIPKGPLTLWWIGRQWSVPPGSATANSSLAAYWNVLAGCGGAPDPHGNCLLQDTNNTSGHGEWRDGGEAVATNVPAWRHPVTGWPTDYQTAVGSVPKILQLPFADVTPGKAAGVNYTSASPPFAGVSGEPWGFDAGSHPNAAGANAAAGESIRAFDNTPIQGGAFDPVFKWVKGQLFVATPGLVSSPDDIFGSEGVAAINRKLMATGASCGSHPLIDRSGPGSGMVTGTEGSYTYCVARVKGECSPGSTVGQVYVNCPGVAWNRCTGSGIHGGTPMGVGNDICVANVGAAANAVRQFSLDTTDFEGAFTRTLVSATSRLRMVRGFENNRLLPDNSWLVVPRRMAELQPGGYVDGEDAAVSRARCHRPRNVCARRPAFTAACRHGRGQRDRRIRLCGLRGKLHHSSRCLRGVRGQSGFAPLSVCERESRGCAMCYRMHHRGSGNFAADPLLPGKVSGWIRAYVDGRASAGGCGSITAQARDYAGKRFVIHAVQADWSRATTAAAVSP